MGEERTTLLKHVVFALVLFLSAAAEATSLKDFWQSRPANSPHFQTAKSSLSLEMCIGMDLSELSGAPPNVLHGEAETILTSVAGIYQNTPVGGVRIVDHGTTREVAVGALQSGGWTNKISAVVQRCI